MGSELNLAVCQMISYVNRVEEMHGNSRIICEEIPEILYFVVSSHASFSIKINGKISLSCFLNW